MKIPRLAERSDVATVLDGARYRSEATLDTLRSVAADLLGGESDLIIGVNGSIARREETAGSDVDLFVLTLSGDIAAAKAVQAEYRERLVARGIKMPAHGGVFESPLRTTQLTATIGGEDDTNTYITRRMLYLLEGEWVANKDGFDHLRSELVARYVSERPLRNALADGDRWLFEDVCASIGGARSMVGAFCVAVTAAGHASIAPREVTGSGRPASGG